MNFDLINYFYYFLKKEVPVDMLKAEWVGSVRNVCFFYVSRIFPL